LFRGFPGTSGGLSEVFRGFTEEFRGFPRESRNRQRRMKSLILNKKTTLKKHGV